MHWLVHVDEVAGQDPPRFAWACTCGPAGAHWPTPEAAAAALGRHVALRHR